MLYQEFNDLGYAIFGLHGVTKEGLCECLNPDCMALYKHPRTSNWQVTQTWDEDQMECIEETGQLDTGYGVLCKGLIVVDIDARNGGIESYTKLIDQCPEILECGFIVETGSGGGSKHLYFKAPKNIRLNQHHKDYSGIDFKSSGFVVGSGSMHKSGNKYITVYGSPSDIMEAPLCLINLLEMKDVYKSTFNGEQLSVSDSEINDMINSIDPDCEHDIWVRCGMAIHHATNGLGFDIWNSWSEKGKKYPNSEILANRWHSFGKSANPVSLGTLIHYAEQNGYIHQIGDITFTSEIDWGEIEEIEEPKRKRYNLLKPPGLVGRIAKWINSRSMYPRENLAVAAALIAVSNAGGLRYRCEEDGIAGNLFAFCVAGSGTGKESILQSLTLLMREAGIISAVHGNIKSEQEIYRNIIDHQASFYTIDEIGEMLAKIQGARQKSGSSSYLEGIFGALMGIFSKANGIQLITGDSKKALKKDLQNEYNAITKKINENESKDNEKERQVSLKKLLIEADQGIVNPFLNIIGFTAPQKFSTLLDQDMADNGFFARAIIFRELEDNPKFKEDYKPPKSEDQELKALGAILSNLYHAGHTYSGRVELMGKIEKIPSSLKAKNLFNQIRQDFWEMGEVQKESHGLVAYTRRGAEMVSRIALILSMGEHERTEEHLMWANELIKEDMKSKILMTNANTDTDKGGAIISKILTYMSSSHGITVAVLKNKMKNVKQDIIEKALEHLIIKSELRKEEVKPVRGKPTTKYFKAI